jgi:hypothetical protein
MTLWTRLGLTITALALLASWAMLGRAQAGPTPAQNIKGYMPLKYPVQDRRQTTLYIGRLGSIV